MITFDKFYMLSESNKLIDDVQVALDVAGLEPTIGTAADAANGIISVLRASMAKTSDEKDKHLINAGISAVSLIPFADVIKLLKVRKLGNSATRLAVKGARGIKQIANNQKITRFDEKNIHDAVHPGILKRQVKGKMTCSKARSLKSKQKNKGNNTAKASQRYINYHC